MKSIVNSLLATAVLTVGLAAGTAALADDPVKIGFLVKQPEEPWFQTEWMFADKAAADNGFEVVKIAVPDGERTLSAIDSLAANGVEAFVICTPDVRLGPAIVAKAASYDMKVIAVDDRFVGADGQMMEDVPYLGLDAHGVGQTQGRVLMEEVARRGWNLAETAAVVNTYDELDTAHQRTSGSVESLIAGGFPEASIYYAANRTTDVPGSFDATNIVLTQHPDVKNWVVIGMNDSAVLGGIRATEGANFTADNVIGIGINGTDAVAELQKEEVTGFYGSLLLSPDVHGYKTTMMAYRWVVDGVEPPMVTPITDVTLITRDNFVEKLTAIGLM